MTDDQFAVQAVGLGKRFGGATGPWALRHCDFAVPTGRICGVMGPNGAGKSTLFALAAMLCAPSEGELRLFGSPLTPDGRGDGDGLRARIGFAAQDKPLYRSFTVADTLRMGRELNPSWNQALAERVLRLAELKQDAKVGSLSGGQRSRLALALAIGKQPELLLLDEPLADLDPLVRHDLLGVLLSDAADRGTTVLISSHTLTELEEVVDHVLLLHSGRVRLAGGVDELLDAHRLVSGPADLERPPGEAVEWRVTGRRATGLLHHPDPAPPPAPWTQERPRLDELLLAHLRGAAAGHAQNADTGAPTTDRPSPVTSEAAS
ncbi:ATP-binding cassette domain-containing protein [Kitasatospora phosalacinea]|uniref:ATP-binding cassette domain-containing protein n=1 Tax=Kitasatospora phosalacinea TaxID=2065 RepID=UPI002554DC15|nr:ABC transporter ATP-binding protein [Kitasatospora phosalacinea]